VRSRARTIKKNPKNFNEIFRVFFYRLLFLVDFFFFVVVVCPFFLARAAGTARRRAPFGLARFGFAGGLISMGRYSCAGALARAIKS
jgi:hypothetical protein